MAPVRSQSQFVLPSPSSENRVSPGSSSLPEQPAAGAPAASTTLRAGAGAFSPPWCAGAAPPSGARFHSGHVSALGEVSRAVSGLALVTPLAVPFTSEKEVSRNSDVFHCGVNDILLLW